jgi:hypothetical protein
VLPHTTFEAVPFCGHTFLPVAVPLLEACHMTFPAKSVKCHQYSLFHFICWLDFQYKAWHLDCGSKRQQHISLSRMNGSLLTVNHIPNNEGNILHVDPVKFCGTRCPCTWCMSRSSCRIWHVIWNTDDLSDFVIHLWSSRITSWIQTMVSLLQATSFLSFHGLFSLETLKSFVYPNKWPCPHKLPWCHKLVTMYTKLHVYSLFKSQHPVVTNFEYNRICWTKQTPESFTLSILSTHTVISLCSCPFYIPAHTETWRLTQVLCHLAHNEKVHYLFDSTAWICVLQASGLNSGDFSLTSQLPFTKKDVKR